ncbi:MAG: hypothetical protein WCV93_04625 [Candidatus Shapirobacteria bacterium]|jgi:hypothetical protein
MPEKFSYFFDSEKFALPFDAKWIGSLSILSGGQVQTTMIHSRDGVIHISPALSRETNENEAIICSRWIHPKKGLLTANQQNLAKSDIVTIPKVKVVGDVRPRNGVSYPFWLEEEVEGKLLNQVVLEGKPTLGIYRKLVKWMAEFHSPTEGKTSLKANYNCRLGSIESILKNDEELRNCLGPQRIEAINRLLILAKQNIASSIDENELVDKIHGDLRGNNVMINEKSVSVIDFEQGLFGGDWYYDLEKLLLIEKHDQPDVNKPYMYFPNLSQKQKYSLVKTYSKERAARGWELPTIMQNYLKSHDPIAFESRRQLYDIENALSIMIFRHLMGWDFGISPDGSNRRGVNFIADLVIQNYNHLIFQKNNETE